MYISKKGGYTSPYNPFDLAAILTQLNKRTVAFIVFLGIVMVAFVMQRSSWRRWEPVINENELIWPIGFLSYIAIMLPWPNGTSGFYITGGAFFMVGSMALTVILFLRRFQSRWMAWAMVSAIFLFVVNRAGPIKNVFISRSSGAFQNTSIRYIRS